MLFGSRGTCPAISQPRLSVLDKVTAWDGVEPTFRRSIIANRSCQDGQMLAMYFSSNGEKVLTRPLNLELSHLGSTEVLFTAAISIILCND